MIISSKGKYAMRFMIDLANYYQAGPVAVKDISKRQDISDKYLEQIVASLNKAGLVKSSRGARGGYVLRQSPEKYKAYDILRAVEGDLSPVEGEALDDVRSVSSVIACNRLWMQLDDSVYTILNQTTLADLVAWEKESKGGLDAGCWI